MIISIALSTSCHVLGSACEVLCDSYVVCNIRNVAIFDVLNTFCYVPSAMCYVFCLSYVICSVSSVLISLVLSRLCYALWSMRRVLGAMRYAKCVYFLLYFYAVCDILLGC